MLKKKQKSNYGVYALVSLLVVSTLLVGVIQIGKAQQRSEISELTEFSNSLGGNAEAFIAGIAYLTGEVSDIGQMLGSSGDYLLSSFTSKAIQDDGITIDADAEFSGDANFDGNVMIAGRVQQGGDILASSTNANVGVLTEADLIYSQLDYTPGLLAVSLTLPASSTFTTILQEEGDMILYKIRNLDAVSATSTTIVAGTGIDLVEIDGGDVVIEGGNEALLRFVREADTDITVSVDEYIAAD